MPMFATMLDVDRTDDIASATACTAAPNDCSLRGAIIAANADVSATPVIINLQPATTLQPYPGQRHARELRAHG
jgi:hypothetical protein